MNATCCPNHDTLEAYLLGKVDDDSIDAHLDECSDCQGVLDEMDAAVNLPFAGLRKVATASPDWQQPAFQHLVADAKNLVTVPFHGKTLENQVFGNYLLLNLIGSGGFGQVYKAIHRQLKKTVVVKLLGPAHAQSPESRGRFLREMEAVGRLASPHIVAAHDAGEIDGQLFLVMEHVEGKDLSRLVKDHGPLPIDQALDCVLQAARGLQHAHEAGIIHRDVKPSNLLLDERGTVKVLDLGLARFLCQPEISASVAGTVAFMAPELFEPGRLADERSDIYSLGCTLYVLLTGRVPFETRGPQGKLECPSAVEALFRRMVAHDPHDRPASMNAVIAELQRLMKPARRRHPFGWRSVIAAGVVIAASALVALAFWPPPPDRKAGDTPKTPEEARAPAHVAKIVTMSPNGAGPKIEMASIPAGDFFMGGSDSDLNALPAEKPRQKVKINRPFFLGTTEVTQALYEEIVGVNPSAFSAKGSNKARVKDIDTAKHPVESVSWLDAVCFCNKLSERHGLKTYYKINLEKEVVTIQGGDGYRLPTEAEWEYACRAGTRTSWYFGEKADDLDDHAWFAKNSKDRTHPVGQKKANPWGLHDMLGNVPEWCWDRFDPKYYNYLPASDPPGPGEGRERTFRGEGWNSRLPRTSARPAIGFTYSAQGSTTLIGFRIARNAE